MLCSPGEGAAALVLCRREYLQQLPEARAVWLRSAVFRTRRAAPSQVYGAPGVSACTVLSR